MMKKKDEQINWNPKKTLQNTTATKTKTYHVYFKKINLKKLWIKKEMIWLSNPVQMPP